MDNNDIRKLFYATHADICEDAAQVELEDAREGKVLATQLGAEAIAASEKAHEKTGRMHQGSLTLADLVAEFRAKDSSAFTAYAERAVTDASVSHEDEARDAAERKALIASLNGALEFYHRHLLPAERLATLRADSNMFACAAQLASWNALEAAIVRHDAGKALFEADGSTGFGEHGAAFEAFVAALGVHKKATEAHALVGAEGQRQRMLAGVAL